MALRAVLRRMTVLDRLIVLTLFAAAVGSLWLIGAGAGGQRVVVEQDGRVVFTAPLNQPRTVSIEGPLGETVLAIKNGQACILASPCPHKVCMGMGEVARSGELLACVPNRLLVRIEGQDQERGRDYDLISR